MTTIHIAKNDWVHKRRDGMFVCCVQVKLSIGTYNVSFHTPDHSAKLTPWPSSSHLRIEHEPGFAGIWCESTAPVPMYIQIDGRALQVLKREGYEAAKGYEAHQNMWVPQNEFNAYSHAMRRMLDIPVYDV